MGESRSPLQLPRMWSRPRSQSQRPCVAALAACHMLWFLSIAAKQGFVVERYHDEASGVIATNADRKLAMTQVTLRPRLVFAAENRPSTAQHEVMHHGAHEQWDEGTPRMKAGMK